MFASLLAAGSLGGQLCDLVEAGGGMPIHAVGSLRSLDGGIDEAISSLVPSLPHGGAGPFLEHSHW